MVMGQEEKKNKAKLEKAQAALVISNADYESAIKALEITTERWNREWKIACDVSISDGHVLIHFTNISTEIPRFGRREN
jgi:uncharacterized protein (DUF1800 family)